MRRIKRNPSIIFILLSAFFTLNYDTITAQTQIGEFYFYNDNDLDNKDEPIFQYSEKDLLLFLDSIGGIDNYQLKKQIAGIPETTFRQLYPLNIELTELDFEKIKYAFTNENAEWLGSWLDLKFAAEIFRSPIDTSAVENGLVQVELVSFDSLEFEFNEFVVCIGSSYTTDNNDIYFFKRNRIIGYQHNYSRYGMDMKHFKDEENKTVIYYRENFMSGTGIWQFNNYFYKYDQDKIIPVLNVLQNGNLNGWGTSREFWLETFIENTNPLSLKFVYHIELSDTNGLMENILNDSTIIVYKWDKSKNEFTGNFTGRFNEDELFAYYLEDTDVYFMNVYYKTLRKILGGKNDEKRKATLNYLNGVKNNLNNKE